MDRKKFSENALSLKKCQKIYSLLFWTYALSCIPYACVVIIYAFIRGIIVTDITYLVRGSLLVLAIFCAGLVSIYKKELKFTWIPVAVAIISVFVSGFDDTFMIFFGISVVSSVLLTVTHKKYRFLETQDGFPYFNERFEGQKNGLQNYVNNNPYQQNIERYRNSSGKMDDI
ncbi:MAG: hypothetical protein K2G36_06530 [Ruminococcus sp.]|nr:hypothetical protein [Ruminococcus sp.]